MRKIFVSWLTSYIRPKIKAIVGDTEQSEPAEDLWHKCTGCADMIFHRDLVSNAHVCPKCDKHLRMPLLDRINSLFDGGVYQQIAVEAEYTDPLKFRDSKRYIDRLRDARHKTERDDAIFVAHGKIHGYEAVIVAIDFNFMGGSMGMAVGQGFVDAVKLAIAQKAPLIAIPSSGGARMQEGIISLMQMPRTVAACEELRDANLPYIVLCADPTYGGVTASFAMLGDLHIAEPGSMIGFAGRRVIEQTVREKLPEDFQTAEYLAEHGMIDMVIERKEIKKKLGMLFSLILKKKSAISLVEETELPLAAD